MKQPEGSKEMTKFNPWKKEIAYLQTVNKAISMGYPFYVYRTVDGKVAKYEIAVMGINLETGQLTLSWDLPDYSFDGSNASKLDLQMITQQAQQYQKQALAAKK